MKKTLLITLASIALVSCSQDETVATMDRVAIAFDKVFVENSTGARSAEDVTTNNLTDFAVYGSVVKGEQKGNIFNKQKVAGTQAGGYTYSPAQYWIPSASYHFTAIAPYEGAKWTYTCKAEDESEYGTRQAQFGTITFDNEAAAAEQDLLWAYQSATTEETTPDAVRFTFQHMLSRAKFTFVNDFEEGSNISLKVKAIIDAHSVGTIELQGTEPPTMQWTATADKEPFQVIFGEAQYVKDADGNVTQLGEDDKLTPQLAASTDHYYLLPVADTNYHIGFIIELYQAGVLLQTIEKTTTVIMPSMKRGYSYDFKAKLSASNTMNEGPLEPIEFKVTGVEDWKDYTSVDANITTQTPGTNQ